MGKKNGTPSVLKNLNKANHHKQIKLRYKALASGGYSLYLDMWHNGKRQYEFLKIYIEGRRNTLEADREKLRLAIAIRDKRELALMQNDNDLQLSNWKTKANFVEYFKNLADSKAAFEKAWRNTYKHLKDFTKGQISFKQVDPDFCESFKDYLLEHVSTNTAHTYFSKIKAALNKAIKERIIFYNPANGIQIKLKDSNRQFLTLKEVKTIKDIPCENEQVKNAFLFSCFTGLRISDIRALTFNSIREGYLHFQQQKTRGVERIKLSQSALDILREQKQRRLKGNTLVFKLPSETTIRKYLRAWIEAAGIKKRISFHCARHTFATMCLTSDIDLFTVSKLLGHRDIKDTQIYAKLIDKKKDQAIDKLPVL